MLSAFKNFGVTFLIALIIFGITAYFATSFVTNTMNSIMSGEREELENIFENEDSASPPGEQKEENATSAGEIPGSGFNLLLVITDYRPDVYGDYMPTDVDALNQKSWSLPSTADSVGYLSKNYRSLTADTILLVRGDKELRQYTYTYFSSESRVYTPSGYQTLGDVYRLYGMETLSEHIHALTGIRPTHQIVINGYNLDEAAALLGTVTVNLSRDIYLEEESVYTTQYEYTRDAYGADGQPYVEHIPNTYVLGVGAVELTAENLSILSMLEERSQADISLKEGLVIEAVRQYLARLAALDDNQLRILFSQLTLNESEWLTIEGYEPPPEPETEETAEGESGEPETEPETEYPWWDLDGDSTAVDPSQSAENPEEEGETGEGETTEDGEPIPEGEEETEEEIVLFEPETPVFEASFSVEELWQVVGVLRASLTFEHITVSYPGVYVTGTEEEEAYFEPDLRTGIDTFVNYR